MAFKMTGTPFQQNIFKQKKCAKCGVTEAKHKNITTHAFTTSASDPDWEGGDTYDVKPKK